jgi:hypothetical protein
MGTLPLEKFCSYDFIEESFQIEPFWEEPLYGDKP